MAPTPPQPAFSVIMPVFNHADFVRDAIRSVRGQTFHDWELIVVDDGSTDATPEILAEEARRDARIRVARQDNAGPAAARNAAIALSRADWLTYIDSDDVWFPDALASYAAYIAAHPDAGFIYGYRHRMDPDGAITHLPARNQDRPTGTTELFRKMYLSHLCVCYRRRLLDLAGPYDATLRRCEDYELYLRISLHTRFEPLGKATGARRRHRANLSRRSGYSRLLQAEVLRRFVDDYGGAKVLDPSLVRRRLGGLYCSAAVQYFKRRCFRQALRALVRARPYRLTLDGAAVGVLSLLLLPFGTTDGRDMPHL